MDNIRNYATDLQGWSAFGNMEEFKALPETHQQQILFLDATATKYLWSFTGPSANLFTGGEWNPFAKNNFRTVEECEHLVNSPESNRLLKKWLYKRGIPFDTWIFVLFEGYKQGVLMTWKMLIKYCSEIFFFEDVVLFDRTLNWAMFYFHENQLFFGKDNQYDPTENEQMMQALNERKKNFPQFRHPYL